MKFSNVQLIAVIAIFIAGIILAHVFAPAAAAAVISIATTVIGVLFVQRDDKDPPEGGAGMGGKLTVIPGGLKSAIFGVAVALLTMGCGSTFAELEDAANNGDDKAKIALCRGESRAAFYIEGKSESEALARFDACVKRASK